ncbi:MAG: AAA family ATPase, partial [Patescibacteria group bacterium]
MYLKSIELSGFKSFAKKNSFEFNSPISSIVGPNGSGKSNVAEAFRFVLGEQSIKSMRGKRGEDLIWNGAGSEPRANRASVKVVFDNERKIFDLDFSEVTIERVVHRDGLNEYFINGSPSRLKDILELLSRAHIGASGHHIISQGEADKIISASSKDRKAMVEDALGLKLYQYKRLESERKLKKTFENIGQVEALRKEIAPHLKFLKKQVEKLEKTESLRDELINVSKEFFKREELYLSASKADIESERKPLNHSLEKLHKELEEAKKV